MPVKLTSIGTGPSPEDKAYVIEMLEAALERARNGEIYSLCLIEEMPGKMYQTIASGCMDRMHQLAQLDFLKLRLMQNMRDSKL
jgi:hypothetical protein